MNSSISSSRDARLDLLRLVAFFLLIACHTCDPFNAAATYGSGEADAEFTRWGAIWGAVVRPCVPVFVMLTGALLLGRSRASLLAGRPVAMRSFYACRIPRVLWPFLIWSCCYYLFPWVLDLLGFGADAVTLFFPWAETTSQTFATAIGRVVRIPYSFSYVACHMWYIYMLLGLYLYLPVFDTWVSQATRRQKSFVLVLWGLSTFIPYITEFVSPYSFGTCDWNQYGLFYNFAGFNGYLLLGHFLRSYVRLPFCRALFMAVPLYAAGYVVNLLGYRHILTLESPTPQQVELFWTYCTPNVLAQSLAVTLVCLSLPLRNMCRQTWISSITRCGFGIYMLHYFFVGPAFWLVTACMVPVSLRVPVSAVLVLAASWSLVALLHRLLGPRLGRIVLG